LKFKNPKALRILEHICLFDGSQIHEMCTLCTVFSMGFPWISYTIDDGYVYIASFQPMGRFSDFSATGK
jgi:hypothetical protein